MLEIKNVSSGYGKKQVLTDVCATFEKNKFTAIIGPNGCGKSTLLKTIIGIIGSYSGEIIFDGECASEMTRKDMAKKAAYLSQGKSVADMTVSQMVLHGRFAHLNYPRRYTNKDKELAMWAMKSMGIDAYADAEVSSLSGGMRQAAYIAMLICQNTDFILLDEPTTYLDISNTLKLIKMLKEFAKNGKGVIAVIHDLIFALEYADEIVVMKDGKILMHESSVEVYNSGVIYDVFGVKIDKVKTQTGYTYCYLKND